MRLIISNKQKKISKHIATFTRIILIGTMIECNTFSSFSIKAIIDRCQYNVIWNLNSWRKLRPIT